jgi:hypothetical protein
MSNIHFKIGLAKSPIKVRARYVQTDYTLVLWSDGGTPAPTHRLAIDTLSLLFTPNEHVFIGFDAYTNSERWKYRQLCFPTTIDQKAALICLEPFDEHGIGMSGSDEVLYTYSKENAVLRIEIGSGQVVTRVQCFSCAICCLGARGELLEIWLQGLGFDYK